MKRANLLLLMALMTALMAAVIVIASPYAPVIQGVLEIEEVWAIEDARQESEIPLVTALECNGIPMAYDEGENTFYCPLGLETGGDWPQMKITAPGAKEISLCFVDDYSYDWCDEAIAEGYAYELMAYGENSYSYFYVVFTGLPILSVRTREALSTEDSSVQAVFSAENGMLRTEGDMHMRGNGTLEKYEKKSYKLTLTDGENKKEQQVPGLCTTDEVILLSMVIDDSLMHDRLCWDLVDRMTGEDESFAPRPNGYIELFIDDVYAGVYLMMDAYDSAKEIAREDAEAVMRDSLYRTAHNTSHRDGERAFIEDPLLENMCYELFYTADPQNPFRVLDDYFVLEQEENDEVFSELAPEVLDLRSFLAYDLLIQATGMNDTVHNNTYFWAHREGDAYRYRVLPWDMDLSWGIDMGQQMDRWIPFNTVDRIIQLDAGGARGMMLDIWNEMKDAGFNQETIEALTAQYMRELNESGASLREYYRWNRSVAFADATSILDYCQVRFALLDDTLSEIAASPQKPVPFLENIVYSVYNADVIHILE